MAKNPLGASPGRPRKWKTPDEMLADWEKYKKWADSQTTTIKKTVTVRRNGQSETETVTEKKSTPVTYTLTRFCVFAGIGREAFTKTYKADPRFCHVVDTIDKEIEADAREKFERGLINSRLAPLWMSKHGYSTAAKTASDHTIINNLGELLRSAAGTITPVDDDEEDEEP